MIWNIFKKNTNVDLLDTLIDTVAKNDKIRLIELCANHADEIKEKFPSWKTAPEKYLKNQDMAQKYGNTIMCVAQVFSNNGDKSLFSILSSNTKKNQIEIWQAKLESAQKHVENNQFSKSINMLEELLIENNNLLAGTAIKYYLPRTYGLLGTAYYKIGNVKKSIENIQKAKSLCEECGDDEGVRVYSKNLNYIVQDS